jgi:hypothetical protein
MAEHPKFKTWINREIFRRDGKLSPETMAENDLNPANLRIEVKHYGKWTVAE